MFLKADRIFVMEIIVTLAEIYSVVFKLFDNFLRGLQMNNFAMNKL